MKRVIVPVLCWISSFCWVHANAPINDGDSCLQSWSQSPQLRWCLDVIDAPDRHCYIKHCFDASTGSIDKISLLHNPLMIEEYASWEFYLKYECFPSSMNNWCVWISDASSSAEFGGSELSTAYVLGVNYRGSDDTLKFWRVQSNKTALVFQSDVNWQEQFGADKVVYIKLERFAEGYWQLHVDSSVFSFEDEGLLFDQARFFGLSYKYSSSNDRKLEFGAVKIAGLIESDKEGPVLVSSYLWCDSVLCLKFNEPIFIDSLNCDLVAMQDVIVGKVSTSEIQLELSGQGGSDYKLDISGIQDVYGNNMLDTVLVVAKNKSHEYDILISELMPDPSPSNGLNEVEFVELYNASGRTVNLKDWLIQIGETEVKLPHYDLQSGRYLCISEKSIRSDLDALLLEYLPSLSNSKGEVRLRRYDGKLIHWVGYSIDWHQLDYKKEGGWSLEMIDLLKPCLLYSNWSSSIAYQGGTPGMPNSIDGVGSASMDLGLSQIEVHSDTLVKLLWTESLPMRYPEMLQEFKVKGMEGGDFSVIWGVKPNELLFQFREPLEAEKSYTILVPDSFGGCNGNVFFGNKEISFALPDKIDFGDLVINEVMFDPDIGFPEYVELYNASNSYYSLQSIQLVIGEQNPSYIRLSELPVLIAPNEFKLFTSDWLSLMDEGIDPQCLLKGCNWKALSNQGGLMRIHNAADEEIDIMKYDRSMHSELIDNPKGVSLERISPYVSGLNRSNWHSASSISGYMTPGAVNSQFIKAQKSNSLLQVDPQKISPNNDGLHDIMQIVCSFDGIANSVSIRAYNLEGNMVRSIADNELVGQSAIYHWDGLDHHGRLLPVGCYVLLLEGFSEGGLKYDSKVPVLLSH